ncbi:MAG: tetratricopeptide repeat protein [Bdellovibrionota bacterium]
MDNKDQDSWLIRDLSNVIRGPYKHQEVLNLIKRKQLKNKTEISRANSYWFAVEEKAELARFFPELGLEAPPEQEKQTQMTATLTHADMADEKEDVTTFVATPDPKEDTPPDGSRVQKGEWLSQEMADEFGDFDDFAMVTATNTEFVPEEEEGLPVESSPSKDEQKPAPGKEAPRRSQNEVSTEEMLKRATVKADTLPSELKDFQGVRPKPITNLIRGPERNTPGASSLVQVPIEKNESHANILSIEAEEAAAAKRKQHLLGTLLIVAVLGLAALIYLWVVKHPAKAKTKTAVATGIKYSEAAEESLRRSLVLYDLEGAKEALSNLEIQPEMRGKALVAISQALIKKEFLFDTEGALGHLQVARSLANDSRTKGEVSNLIAVYSFEHDSESAISILQDLLKSDPDESIYRYNLTIALLRNNRPSEALAIVGPLMNDLKESDPLYSDASFAQGWAQEQEPRTREQAEGAFLRAISSDPTSGKARLGLAIHRLRKIGFRSSEADFRAFIDSIPDLDPPSRVINFRKIQGNDFYNQARGWIRELNLDGPMGSKPAPLIMAVDAMLSCLQNRTGEAGKILESALSASNGDLNVLKAVGYHRWKEGRYAEIVELFRDVPKDKMGFSVPYMVGKALVKLDRRSQADKMFETLTFTLPNRSEGWALLGDSLAQSGKKSEAQQKLINAIRRDPRDLVALRALGRLGHQEIFSDETMSNLPF